jgi:hypothetical protein
MLESMVELSLFVCLFFGVCRLKSEKHVYMYKQGRISIHKKYRHVNANVSTWKEKVPKVQSMLMQM